MSPGTSRFFTRLFVIVFRLAGGQVGDVHGNFLQHGFALLPRHRRCVYASSMPLGVHTNISGPCDTLARCCRSRSSHAPGSPVLRPGMMSGCLIWSPSRKFESLRTSLVCTVAPGYATKRQQLLGLGRVEGQEHAPNDCGPRKRR